MGTLRERVSHTDTHSLVTRLRPLKTPPTGGSLQFRSIEAGWCRESASRVSEIILCVVIQGSVCGMLRLKGICMLVQALHLSIDSPNLLCAPIWVVVALTALFHAVV